MSVLSNFECQNFFRGGVKKQILEFSAHFFSYVILIENQNFFVIKLRNSIGDSKPKYVIFRFLKFLGGGLRDFHLVSKNLKMLF